MFDSVDEMQKKISQLETDLREREHEVNFLKTELSEANYRLEQLVQQSRHELQVLKKIQECLVPTEFPNITGFEFSTKFVPSPVRGGDYFDIFDVAEKMQVGAVLSCSSGYGMSALLMSVLMKFSGFQLARKMQNSQSIVKSIADELSSQLSEQDAASLFFGLINRRTFKFDFCLLGKILAFHYDYEEGELRQLEATGGQIGKGFNEELVANEVTLNPRDRFLVCSEGILETKNLEGESLSVETLLSSIKKVARGSVHDLRNEVLFQAEKFSSSAELPRDRTVIALEVKDRVIKLAKG